MSADTELDEPSGLSPNALLVYVSPDMLPRWRLFKSVALDNARWAVKHHRPDIARQNVAAARFNHLQIMRIKRHVRARTGQSVLSDADLLARLAALRETSHVETTLATAVDFREGSARAPDERGAHDANRDRDAAQHQDNLDVSLARDGEAQAQGGHERHRVAAGRGEGRSRAVRGLRQARKHPQLTNREFETASLLAAGKSTEQIAITLGIAQTSVSVYVCTASARLGLAPRSGRLGLAMWARENLTSDPA